MAEFILIFPVDDDGGHCHCINKTIHRMRIETEQASLPTFCVYIYRMCMSKLYTYCHSICYYYLSMCAALVIVSNRRTRRIQMLYDYCSLCPSAVNHPQHVRCMRWATLCSCVPFRCERSVSSLPIHISLLLGLVRVCAYMCLCEFVWENMCVHFNLLRSVFGLCFLFIHQCHIRSHVLSVTH